MIRCRDEHGVNILTFEQFPVVGITLALTNTFGARETALVNVGGGNHFDIVRVTAFDEAAEVTSAHAAAANDCKADAIVRSQNGGVTRARKRHGASGHDHRISDETTAGKRWLNHGLILNSQ